MLASLLVSILLPSLNAATIPVRVLDSTGKPQADAVVFVLEYDGVPEPTAKASFVVDQVGTEFIPHVLTVPVGSAVRFPNKDNLRHQLYSFSSTKVFELPLYVGEQAEPVVFDKPGVVKLGCNIHDWMQGFVVVTPTPYSVKTAADGRALLIVPDKGKLKVAVFHERNPSGLDSTQRAVDKRPTEEMVWKLPLRPAQKKAKPAEYR